VKECKPLGGGGGGVVGVSGGGGGDGGPRGIHVMSTSNGSPYLNWQTRIMYQTFLKVRPAR